MVLIAPVPGHCLPLTFQDFSMPFQMYVNFFIIIYTITSSMYIKQMSHWSPVSNLKGRTQDCKRPLL